MTAAVALGSSRPNRAARALPYVTFFLTGIITTLLGPILPWLVARWSLADAQAGAFFSAQFAASVAAGFASGLVVARLGHARTISLGLACMTTGSVGIAAGGAGTALAAAGLCGIGIGLAVPTTNMLVARAFPSAASAALSALNLAWGAGAAVWPLAVATVRDGRSVLFTLALVLSITTIAALRVKDVDTPSRSAAVDNTREAVAHWWFFVAFFFLYGGSEAAVGGWMTELAHRLNRDAPAAIAAAAFWGGLTAGRAVVAMLVADAQEWYVALSGAALAIVAVAALTVAGDAWIVILAGAFAGFGLAPLFPITVALLSRAHASRSAGPLISLSSVGGAILPWLVGAASTRSGSLQTGLVVPLVGCIAVGVLHATYWWRRRRSLAQ